VTPGCPPTRRLRPRGEGVEQPITTVELFFDLVYVFAVTQLSHMILGDLTVAEVGRAAFLLLIVWWAWICTTWMVNWFDPASPAVRAVLTAVICHSETSDANTATPARTARNGTVRRSPATAAAMAAVFQRARQRQDPEGKFLNDFAARVFEVGVRLSGILEGQSEDVVTHHVAK